MFTWHSVSGQWGRFGSERTHNFEKGALKFIILDMLKDNAVHGYELIRMLEERSQGFYSPSAGVIYPTLQLLADMGYITAREVEGKKIYSITDSGRAYLKENQETVDRLNDFATHRWPRMGRGEWRETFRELHRLGHLFRDHYHELNDEKMLQIRQLIQKAVDDIEKVIETK